MRRVTSTMSSVREVLPGKKYILPSSLGKLNFLETSFDNFSKELNKDLPLPSAIVEKFIGFSTTFAKSIFDNNDLLVKNISNDELYLTYTTIKNILENIKNNSVKFELTQNKKDYYITEKKDKMLEMYSEFLDEFYSVKEKSSVLKNSKLNIEREINSQINKLKKKLSQANEILIEEPNLEKFKQYGELISSNIYKMQIGMDKLITENFYENGEMIEIPLIINRTPSQNAQAYFKKYSKLKNSIIHAKEHKKSYEADITYLESVLFNLSEAQNLSELDDIRDELITVNIIKKPGKRFKRKELPSEPIKYEKDGIEILVGRNNLQNDKLTFKIARKTDTWLHTKNIHGSHVIIRSNEISDEVLLYAAKLAAKHSKAKSQNRIEVDYTLVKYVHKESGSKPGMVVYTNYNSIIV